MHILLTGCTGFVGKFVLKELLERSTSTSLTRITCLFRGKKSQSVKERWDNYKNDSLFLYSDLSRVSIKEGDLDNLNSITWDENEQPDIIVHCAANVKTLDAYPNLYRDNVIGVQHMCEAAIEWGVPRVIFISTCYVHPRGTVGKAELLAKDLPRSLFTTDYTYTKYLGEHIASKYSDQLNISILRLSCVGAPCGWLDAHPTPGAMAHLGLISLMLRKSLYIIRVPSMAYISTIPVDIASRSIVDEIFIDISSVSSDVRVKHICAPANSSKWNLNCLRVCNTVQRLSPNTPLRLLDCSEDEFENRLTTMWGFSAYTPYGYKSYMFHREVNRFISKFADSQYFESSVPDEYFPDIADDTIYEQTCMYVARGNQQHILEKGFKKFTLDKLANSIAENKIQVQIIFTNPIAFKTKKQAEERFFNCFAGYRPFFTDPDLNSSLTYSTSRKPVIAWSYNDAIKGNQACQVELLGDYTDVKGFKISLHHGIGDGIAYLGLLPRVISLSKEQPQQSIQVGPVKSRSISMSQELACFIYYFASLVKVICQPDLNTTTSSNQTIEMTTVPVHKSKEKSFTALLLEKSYPVFRSALGRDTIVYCIPAAIEKPSDRGLNLPHNAFIPIIIPWTATNTLMQEMCLHSNSVKCLNWVLCQLIGISELRFLHDLFINKVDVLVSSLLASQTAQESIKSFHFLAPSPYPIPFTLCALTVGNESHITVRSSLDSVPAEKIMNEILASK